MANRRGVNESVINRRIKVNYSVNSHAINEVSVGGDLQQSPPAFQLLTIEQSVKIGGSGQLVAIEQGIILRISGAGSLVDIEQSITNSASGALIEIEQRINSAGIISVVDKYGFNCFITVGGVAIESDKIHGLISISRAENSAAIASFQIIPDSGTLDLNWWRGKTVLIDIETVAGINRIYTGTVDIPEIDLINGVLLVRCTNRRNEQINSGMSRSTLNFIGQWHSSIFEDADDFADELSYRLRTITKTVDFDAYNQLFISDFLPKSSADFTLSSSEIYRRQPTLELASRGRLINKVNLDFGYSYVRLRHRIRNFTLSGPTHCEVMFTNGLGFLTREGITSSINSFGWAVQNNSITFVSIPPDGKYYCDTVPTGMNNYFNWRKKTKTSDIVAKKDSDCNVVTDSNGATIYEAKNIKIVDSGILYAMSASWGAAKDFAQDIAQEYLVTITAPQSIAQYGEIEQNQSNGHAYDYDSTDFERTKKYTIPAGFTSNGGGEDSFLDQKGTLADFSEAFTCAVNIAQTTIKKSHRDNHVTFERSIWPEIDLRHTVSTTAGLIQATGKVSNIQHDIDINKRFAETTVKISFSQSVGSSADSSITIPTAVPSIVGGISTDTININVYETDSSGAVITNAAKVPGLTSPDIDDLSRNRHEITSTSAMTVEISNDSLVVTL